MSKESVYLRFRNRHYVKTNGKIFLGQIAQIVAPDHLEKDLMDLFIDQVTLKNQHMIVIDMLQVIKKIKTIFPEIEVRSIGSPEIIVEVLTSSVNKKANVLAVVFVWFLLFFGSGLAIMNFHHDVSMEEVHQRLYYLITGTQINKPLLLQIPYSLGIGIGMMLFFNHLFKKKINEEPSPLEVEIFLYQQNLDKYIVLNENEENWKNKK